MRPLIITSGGAPANVIGIYRDEIRRISNCILLDTSLNDVKSIGPISKNNPGYMLMNEGLDDKVFLEHTGIAIGCSVLSNNNGTQENTEGRRGMGRQKEDFILAFALDDKLGISERIWTTIESYKLRSDVDYILFIAGLGGGTGSGSINGIAGRYYQGKGSERIESSKHFVLGILPSIKENDRGENLNRLKFNTIWALYELLRPIKRPNPLILLDNEAMDRTNPRPTKPVMEMISMLTDWRPDKDGVDFFAKYGTKTMVPYYASIEKYNIFMISETDIDAALANLPVDQKGINSVNDSSGRWFYSIDQNDINRVIESAKKKQSEINNIYIITKGLPNSLRNSMKKKVANALNIDEEKIGMEIPLLDKPGKVEILILLFFNNPFDLNRIDSLFREVKELVEPNKSNFLENAFAHITNDDVRNVLNDFVEQMIDDLSVYSKDIVCMPKHIIRFYPNEKCFKVVPYVEADSASSQEIEFSSSVV